MNKTESALRREGFTLVEMVVSIAIFSVIAIAVYSTTVHFAEVKRNLDERTDQLAAMNKAFLLLQRDLRYAAKRPAREGYGVLEAEFNAGLPQTEPNSDQERLLFELSVFTPSYSEPDMSSLSRVGWRKVEDRLERYVWPVMDRAQDTEPSVQTILSGVADIVVQYYVRDPQGAVELEDQWLSGIRPPGIRMELTMQDGSSYVRVFEVAG